MSELLEEMSGFFNARAEQYNAVHLEHVGGIESKEIIATFLPEDTKTILDIGIGTGLELEGIYKRFPDAEVTGIDIAENMLQILKKSYPNKKINLHCESYFEYDYKNKLFDTALSVMTLHHYTHEVKTELYRKIFSSIKQGGVYIECDYMLSEHEYESAQEMEEHYFSEYTRKKKEQGLADDNEYHYDTPCTVANQVKMLLEAGFTNVREMWRNGNAVLLVAEKSIQE